VLNQIAIFRGLPKELLTDNGPEFTSNAMSAWAYDRKVDHIFIDPGKPMQNGYIESFNGKLRAECLDQHWFRNLSETREILEDWRLEYNRIRPHSSLNKRVHRKLCKPPLSDKIKDNGGFALWQRTGKRANCAS
jgi:putative transposase